MIITFALLIGTLAAVSGWGYGTVAVLRLLKSPSPYQYDVLIPIIGFVTLTTLVNIENFFYPVGFKFALFYVLVGWGLFLLSLPRLAPFFRQPIWVAIGFVWLGIISTQAVLQAWNYDSGLYHIPAIRWLVDSEVPFGLANLHGRLGFNSAWFSTSALLAQATMPYTPNYTALASEALFASFGLAVLVSLYRLLHQFANALSTIFMVFSGLLGFAPLVIGNLSSPSTDHPVLLLSLFLAFVFLRALETQELTAFRYEFWLAVLFTCFIVMIKISMLPLFLVPLMLIWVGKRRNFASLNWKNLLLPAFTTVLTFGIWLIRGLVLSGCLIYPIGQTCIWSLPWAVTRAQVENEAMYIMSWAREPRVSPSQVLANWNWLRPWSWSLITSMDFILPIICFGIGLGVALIVWRQVRMQRGIAFPLALGAISIIGMLWWFITAPDLRFGSTWFWILGLLPLSVAFWLLDARPAFSFVLRAAVVLLLIGSAISVANVGVSYIQRAGWSYESALYKIPPMPVAEIQVKKTDQGIPINVVQNGDRCFWTSEFCTPYFQSQLFMERTSSNRLFIYAPK